MPISECPKCGTKNRVPEDRSPGQRPVCASCKTALVAPAKPAAKCIQIARDGQEMGA